MPAWCRKGEGVPLSACTTGPATDVDCDVLAVRQIYARKDKTQALAWVLGDVLVPLTGIELVTFALRMRCSTD